MSHYNSFGFNSERILFRIDLEGISSPKCSNGGMQTKTRKKFNCKTIRTKLVKFETKVSFSLFLSLKYLMLELDTFSSAQPSAPHTPPFLIENFPEDVKLRKDKKESVFYSPKKLKFPSYTNLESNFSLSIKVRKRKKVFWIWNLIKWQRMTLTMIRLFLFLFQRKWCKSSLCFIFRSRTQRPNFVSVEGSKCCCLFGRGHAHTPLDGHAPIAPRQSLGTWVSQNSFRFSSNKKKVFLAKEWKLKFFFFVSFGRLNWIGNVGFC